MISIMLTLAWICAGLALFPAALTLWNLLLYRPPPKLAHPTPISVLIPARNEAERIAQCVEAALANRDIELEVIVLDDHSTDATAAIVEDIARSDARLRLERAGPLPSGWSGKQHACHRLAGLARHPLLVFIDADVVPAADAFGRIAAFMARHPGTGLASGFPRELTGTTAEDLVIPLIHFLLLGYLPIQGMRQSLSPGFGAACGQLMVARADAYRTAGGHAAIRASLHDGVKLPRAFRRAGFMTDLFDAGDLAACRMYRGGAEVWAGFSKNATEGMASPMALPIWTVLLGGGHLLPPLLLLGGFATGAGPDLLIPAAVGTAAALGTRLVLALRFRQSLTGALLHPIGIAVLLAIQWTALWRAWRGQPASWRGRAYPHQG
jgi:hypothetical protein